MSTISASTTSTTAYKVTADTTGTLVLQTGATPTTAVTIDGSQNVGIGTTNVIARATVDGGIHVRNYTGPNTFYQSLVLGITGGEAYIQPYTTGLSQIPMNIEGSIVKVNTGGSERARIDSNGNLLVGTTTAGAGWGAGGKLTVDQGSSFTVLKNSAGASAPPLLCWNAIGTGDDLFITFATETGGTTRGSVSYNRAGGLTVYNTTSDYRAKDIYGPIIDSGSVIDSTPVYMGKMKGATQARPMFIAHETPDYAHTGEKDAVDDEGNPVYQQMDASALVPVMWAEIQSLRQRLAALENK